jgi:hypothetical protein
VGTPKTRPRRPASPTAASLRTATARPTSRRSAPTGARPAEPRTWGGHLGDGVAAPTRPPIFGKVAMPMTTLADAREFLVAAGLVAFGAGR